MRDLRNIARRRRTDEAGQPDRWSEFYVYLVVGWLVAIVLLPLHALLVWYAVFVHAPVPIVVTFLVIGVPLLITDWWLFNWLKDNISFFRWVNRESREGGGRSRK